jgi:hypothetical protein
MHVLYVCMHLCMYVCVCICVYVALCVMSLCQLACTGEENTATCVCVYHGHGHGPSHATFMSAYVYGICTCKLALAMMCHIHMFHQQYIEAVEKSSSHVTVQVDKHQNIIKHSQQSLMPCSSCTRGTSDRPLKCCACHCSTVSHSRPSARSS